MENLPLREKMRAGYYEFKHKDDIFRELSAARRYLDNAGDFIYKGAESLGIDIEQTNLAAKLHEGLERYDRANRLVKEAIKEENKLDRQFREDLAKEFGVAGHPKEGLLYEMAYERGHSDGRYEVYLIYGDLSRLIVD